MGFVSLKKPDSFLSLSKVIHHLSRATSAEQHCVMQCRVVTNMENMEMFYPTFPWQRPSEQSMVIAKVLR